MTDLGQNEGIGPKTELLLNKLNIFNNNDLIRHYPFRYEVLKRTDMTEVKDGDKVTIDGIVEGQPTTIFLGKNLKKIIFRINCQKNIYNISLYNRTYLIENLRSGSEVTIVGKYNRIKNTVVVFDIRFERLPDVPRIEPIYYTTSGLSIKNIAKFINSALTDLKVNDYIPSYLEEKYSFTDKITAFKNIHFPKDIVSLKKARQRLKYEELFMYLLKIQYLKEKTKKDELSINRSINEKKLLNFIENLPFSLTRDQITSLEEIKQDLLTNKRMNRLLQGDVGSGKTIVAFLATYINYLAKYQTALMVPTEILAKQHFKNAQELFKEEKMNIEILTSSTGKKKKEEIIEKLKNKEIDFIIGTQSLIQDNIEFGNLGLIITDEQHRFGVNQRNSFKNKGITPDILSMSATPIPRTYALTIYGDMDVSSIKTKPVGRKEVITYFKKDKDITEVLSLMKEQLDNKHQIYVIAPMIEGESDNEVENVVALEEKMNKAFGKLYTIKSVHGKMEAEEKNTIMNDFSSNKINILISTTVIEVGVDVKNASMIVIFNANLFGMSTIHQLRGRVGRGDIQSYCILLAKNNYDRLKKLEECSDGFEISEYDFQNRGEGDLFGIRQSGVNGLILANFKKDYQLLLKVKDDVTDFLKVLFAEKDKYLDIITELEKIDNLN